MKSDIDINTAIAHHPKAAQQKLLELRALIVSVAQKNGITNLTETLKWGEPAYTCKSGSTLRIDYKEKSPDCVQLFFHCQSKLGDTFNELFGDELHVENSRAILLPLNKPLPVDALKICISMALNYHKIKHLPLLGFGAAINDRNL